MYLLTMDNKTLFQAFNERDRYSGHTVRSTTAYTGKMWMALCIGTSVGKLEMLRPFMDECSMHQPNPAQTLQRSVNCNFIWTLSTQSPGNLVLTKGLILIRQQC
jgi:hypothetical protein